MCCFQSADRYSALQQLRVVGCAWGRENIAEMLTAAEDETWRTPATCRTLGRTKATTVGHFMTVTAAKPTIDRIVAGLSIVISRHSSRGRAAYGSWLLAHSSETPPFFAIHGAPTERGAAHNHRGCCAALPCLVWRRGHTC